MATRPDHSSPVAGPACRRPLLLQVIRGRRWFDPHGRPFVVRAELPLSFDEMVAALYGVAEPAEITTAGAVTGCVAVALALEGLPALAERATRIRRAEQRGTLESPEFLAVCRERVAEQNTTAMPSSRRRWPSWRACSMPRADSSPGSHPVAQPRSLSVVVE